MMEERWDLQVVSRVLDGVLGFLSEFGQDWVANDLRAAAFKLLLGWLLLSLLAIQLAWRTYGHTVTDLYHRQGEDRNRAGRNTQKYSEMPECSCRTDPVSF